jgi:MarR family transcriptional regulator, negative regulator of the multidrug operon emrRAB
MNSLRTQNLLGALAVALTDELHRVTADRAGHGAAAPSALVSIETSPGMSIETLSKILSLSHSGTVRLIDRLVSDGLVERAPGVDGRAVALRLTTKGKQATRSILAERRRVLAGALQTLTAQEQLHLGSLLDRLLSAITRSRGHADHICRLCDESVCPGNQCPVEVTAVRRTVPKTE